MLALLNEIQKILSIHEVDSQSHCRNSSIAFSYTQICMIQPPLLGSQDLFHVNVCFTLSQGATLSLRILI